MTSRFHRIRRWLCGDPAPPLTWDEIHRELTRDMRAHIEDRDMRPDFYGEPSPTYGEPPPTVKFTGEDDGS